MLSALRTTFQPGSIVLLRPVDLQSTDEIAKLVPYSRYMTARGGKATAYVCRNFVCNLPTTSVKKMLENLQPRDAGQGQGTAAEAEG